MVFSILANSPTANQEEEVESMFDGESNPIVESESEMKMVHKSSGKTMKPTIESLHDKRRIEFWYMMMDESLTNNQQ